MKAIQQKINQFPHFNQQIDDKIDLLKSQGQIMQQTTYFCFLDFKQVVSAWVGVGIIVAGLFLIIKSILQYRQAKKRQMMSYMNRYIYFTIFTWGLLFILRLLYAQTLFWLQYNTEQSEQIYSQFSQLSKFLYAASFLNFFFLQSVVLLVCYNWVNNSIHIINQFYIQEEQSNKNNVQQFLWDEQRSNKNRKSSVEKSKIRYKSRFQHLKLQLFNKYFIITYSLIRLIPPFLLIPLILVNDQHYQALFSKIMVIQILADNIIVLIVLTIQVISIRSNNILEQLMDQLQIIDILKKYSLIILCTLLRIVMQLLNIFYLNSFINIGNSPKCYIGVNQDSQKIVEIVFTFLRAFVTNYFTIYIILKIFQLENLGHSQNSLAKFQQSQRLDKLDCLKQKLEYSDKSSKQSKSQFQETGQFIRNFKYNYNESI